MSNENPLDIPHDASSEILREMARRKQQAALAESTLKFSLDTQAAFHRLFADMLFRLEPLGGTKYRTPEGRNAMIVLAIGDDAVAALTDALYDLQNPQPLAKDKNRPDHTEADWWKNGGKPPV